MCRHACRRVRRCGCRHACRHVCKHVGSECGVLFAGICAGVGESAAHVPWASVRTSVTCIDAESKKKGKIEGSSRLHCSGLVFFFLSILEIKNHRLLFQVFAAGVVAELGDVVGRVRGHVSGCRAKTCSHTWQTCADVCADACEVVRTDACADEDTLDMLWALGHACLSHRQLAYEASLGGCLGARLRLSPPSTRAPACVGADTSA